MLSLDLKTENKEWPFTSLTLNREFHGNIKHLDSTVPSGSIFPFIQHLFHTTVPREQGLAFCLLLYSLSSSSMRSRHLVPIAQVLDGHQSLQKNLQRHEILCPIWRRHQLAVLVCRWHEWAWTPCCQLLLEDSEILQIIYLLLDF